LPTAVILTPAPADFGKAATLDPELLAAAATESDGAEGLHIRLPGDHQLWLLDKRPDQPLAVVIPLDDDFPLRAASALRWHQLITDKKVVSDASFPTVLDEIMAPRAFGQALA
jgi:hypothetical protein